MHGAYFSDRTEAGQALAEALDGYAGRDNVVVLALPRGGVPVAYEVARRLQAPLDVIVVRKIGTPGQQELAMGAVASGGALVRNEDVISSVGVDETVFTRAAQAQAQEVLERESRFRSGRAAPDLANKTVIVVDDGVATGATMRVALQALRQSGPASVAVAVPVAPRSTVQTMHDVADDVVCLATPSPFFAVGAWYENFPQVGDDEVRHLLEIAASDGSLD
jgi:predicted phosphoribosyltransferase